MPAPARLHVVLACAMFLPACGRTDAPRVDARIDTLRPGLIQVTSPSPTGWSDSAGAWHYRVTLRLQPAEQTPAELLDPNGIAVDGWGRIYVVESKPPVIKVYDSTGSFIRAIGREGAGPGEFVAAYIAIRGPHLVVHDPAQSRTSLFDTSGTYVRSWTSSCCYYSDIAIDADTLVTLPAMVTRAIGGADRGDAWLRYRIDGTLVDTLFVPRRDADSPRWTFTSGSGASSRAVMSTPVPLSPRVFQALHPDGGFIRGWSGEYRLLRSPKGEDSTAIFVRSWTPERIPDSIRSARLDSTVANAKRSVGEAQALKTARLGEIPVTAPAFQTLSVDVDGNIFARQLLGSDSTRTRYDVFSPAGAWLGTITVPVAVPEWGPRFFGRRSIYTVTEDADGRPMIVRLTRTP